eukprot:Rhum_TRINITY_DN15378_c10_g1::Rhum_TRINITY_DN15378_c10_g1_i1::g.154379::m.154379
MYVKRILKLLVKYKDTWMHVGPERVGGEGGFLLPLCFFLPPLYPPSGVAVLGCFAFVFLFALSTFGSTKVAARDHTRDRPYSCPEQQGEPPPPFPCCGVLPTKHPAIISATGNRRLVWHNTERRRCEARGVVVVVVVVGEKSRKSQVYLSTGNGRRRGEGSARVKMCGGGGVGVWEGRGEYGCVVFMLLLHRYSSYASASSSPMRPWPLANSFRELQTLSAEAYELSGLLLATDRMNFISSTAGFILFSFSLKNISSFLIRSLSLSSVASSQRLSGCASTSSFATMPLITCASVTFGSSLMLSNFLSPLSRRFATVRLTSFVAEIGALRRAPVSARHSSAAALLEKPADVMARSSGANESMSSLETTVHSAMMSLPRSGSFVPLFSTHGCTTSKKLSQMVGQSSTAPFSNSSLAALFRKSDGLRVNIPTSVSVVATASRATLYLFFSDDAMISFTMY